MAGLNAGPRGLPKQKVQCTDDPAKKQQQQQQLYQYTIRPATEKDLRYLPDIERSAGTLFRSIAELASLADDEPMSIDQHETYLRETKRKGFEGGVLVVVAKLSSSHAGASVDAALPVAFIATSLRPCKGGSLAKSVGDSPVGEQTEVFFLHVHEMSVHVDHQRRGLAGRLLNAVSEYAIRYNQAKSGMKMIVAMTLTTLRDVVFNAPIYHKFGFRILPAEDIERVIGREGVTIWMEEQGKFVAGGLARGRCWMTRELPGG